MQEIYLEMSIIFLLSIDILVTFILIKKNDRKEETAK